MHAVSETWRQIMSVRHKTNVFLVMDGVRYDSHNLYSVRVHSSLFPGNGPSVGGAMSAEIDVEMVAPAKNPQPQAKMEIFVAVTDGVYTSEEIPKGVFYIDTRKQTVRGSEEILTIHGYDRMLFAEADYPDTNHAWPWPDIEVVREIATELGIDLDNSVTERMVHNLQIPLPAGCPMRETLGYIAAAYAGAFVISDEGKLRLIQVGSIPSHRAETYLGTETGAPIEIGGELILV